MKKQILLFLFALASMQLHAAEIGEEEGISTNEEDAIIAIENNDSNALVSCCHISLLSKRNLITHRLRKQRNTSSYCH